MDEVVKRAQDNYLKDCEYWEEIYSKAEDDLKFLSDDPNAQWEPNDRAAREEINAPILQINQLNQFIYQVANDIRMNTPTINLIPAGIGSNKAMAEIFKGFIKNIEYESHADNAYDTASLYQIRCGLGFIRIDHEYEDDETFLQRLCIKRCSNPLSIVIDRNSVEPDGSDMIHGTCIDYMSVEDFEEKYTGKEPVSFDAKNNQLSKKGEYVTIAEYYEIEETEKTLEQQYIDQNGEIQTRKRKAKDRLVKRYKLSGKDILEETEFVGKYIPIVPVFGEELYAAGKREIFSLIRFSKDAQRMVNYWKSLESELIQKQPQAPIMVEEGQIDDYAEDWQDPSKAMALRYKGEKDGRPLNPPIRLEPPVISTGVVNASLGAIEDIKASMGVYASGLGQQDNAISGVAINRRKVEGDVATFHFSDNLMRSIQHVGRILMSCIPEIYNEPRIISIIDAEDETQQIGINGALADGQMKSLQLEQGKYDVKVTTGASYTTQREEGAEFFMNLAAQRPELLQVMGDLMFSNMDFTGAEAMAERMKKIIDPKLLEDAEETNPQVLMLAQELEAKNAMIAALGQQVQDKQAELALKVKEEQNDMEIEKAKLELQAIELNLRREEKAKETMLKERELKIKEMQVEGDIINKGVAAAQNAQRN